MLVYCALFVVERKRPCTALLYNARTGEAETFSMGGDADGQERAMAFLLDIARFKYDGGTRGLPEAPPIPTAPTEQGLADNLTAG